MTLSKKKTTPYPRWLHFPALVLVDEWFPPDSNSYIILLQANKTNCTTGTEKQLDSRLQCADTAESTNATVIKAYEINFCSVIFSTHGADITR